MKILIYKRNSLINSSGGAENVMCSMASHFAEAGHDVLFLTRDMRHGIPFYPLDNRVELKQYDRKYNKLRHLCGKILKAAKLLNIFSYFDRDLFVANNNHTIINAFKPDIIIATSPADAVEILYKQIDMPPVIVTLHSCPSYFFKNKKKCAQYKQILKQVQTVQVLQPSFVEELKPYYDGKIEVIGNSIRQNDKDPDYTKKRIIYLARIEPDKQQYELTQAFCKIAKEFPDWTIDFYGDITHPEYKNKCIDLAHASGITGQILFHGITTDVPTALNEASICAFPSRFEGFGMGLAEALTAGLSAIGFKSASGVNELIKDGQNGFLVADIDDFAEKLKRLMSDENLRQNLGRKAKLSMADFAPEVIWEKWDRTIKRTVEQNQIRILVHVHLYYFEMWQELKQAIQNITAPYDLFVTVTEHNENIEKDILDFNSEARIIKVENNGFDIWPFIKVLNDVNLSNYKYIIKLHSKRNMSLGTIRNGFDVSGNKWRKYLYAFLANKTNFEKCLKAFEADQTLGMTANYQLIIKNEKKNKNYTQKAQELLTDLKLQTSCSTYVMGTMFMARAKIFSEIKRITLTEDSFAKSARATTNLLPCAFEILFGYLTVAQDYRIEDVLTSPVRQLYGKTVARLKNFVWRKKVTSSGKIVCKFCKIPIFISKTKEDEQ